MAQQPIPGVKHLPSPVNALIVRINAFTWRWTCRACSHSDIAPTRREAIEAFYLHEAAEHAGKAAI